MGRSNDRPESAGFAGEFDFALSVLSFHHWEEPLAGLRAVRRALADGGKLWIYEMDPEAPADAIRRDRGPVWGFLTLPVKLQRSMARHHGFTVAEVEEVVRPLVAESGFRALGVTRAASTLRMEFSA